MSFCRPDLQVAGDGPTLPRWRSCGKNNSGEASRYKDEQKDIEEKAKEMEAEVATKQNEADRFDLAEVFLEVGLVITSITLLSGRRLFWFLGIGLGVVGIVVAGTAFFVH